MRGVGSRMKTVIIPDIHTKFFEAENIIDFEQPDKIVFLGDYFDGFNDSLEKTQQVALWLKESIFEFIDSLLGGNSSKNNNSYNSSNTDNDLKKITEELAGKNNSSRKSKVSKINEEAADSTLKKDLSEISSGKTSS